MRDSNRNYCIKWNPRSILTSILVCLFTIIVSFGSNINYYIVEASIDRFYKGGELRFFEDNKLDLVARKFFASFEHYDKKTTHLKASYGSLSQLLNDLEDVPSNTNLIRKVAKSLEKLIAHNSDEACQDRSVCETCIKLIHESDCDSICGADDGGYNASESRCPKCEVPIWCPGGQTTDHEQNNNKCPAERICPENLCQMSIGETVIPRINNNQIIESCRSSPANNCTWIQIAEMSQLVKHQGDRLFPPEMMRKTRSNLPVQIGRALTNTIGGYKRLLGRNWSSSKLFPNELIHHESQRIYTYQTNTRHLMLLMASIELDLKRRLCNCRPCKLSSSLLKCTAIPSGCGLIDGIYTSRRDVCNGSCFPMDKCPSISGCREQVLCQDCDDLSLLDLRRVGSQQHHKPQLKDVDPDSPITETEVIKPFELPQKCKFCDQFRNCGQAPLNPLLNETNEGATSPVPYVMGGQTVEKRGRWPSFVRILTKDEENMTMICGGVIVSSMHVITAGHCLTSIVSGKLLKLEDIKVAGSTIERRSIRDNKMEHRREVTKICRASSYNETEGSGLRQDWAILTLNKPFKFDEFLQTACLPTDLRQISKNQDKCYVTGLGASGLKSNWTAYHNRDPQTVYESPFTNPLLLQELRVKRISCRNWGFHDNDRSRFCFTKTLGPGDTCDGDSGSPILCPDSKGRWSVIGLVSYGYETCNGRSLVGWVGVYTRIPSLLAVMKRDCDLFD